MDNTFNNDLETGKEAEWCFLEYLRKQFPTADLEFNESEDITELKKWDIKLTTEDNKTILFEIKFDKLSEYTKNFAVEYFGKTSASGISTTTSNYWVILSADNFYIFKTNELKSFISNNNFSQINISNGSAWCYLVPIEKAKQIVVSIIPNFNTNNL